MNGKIKGKYQFKPLLLIVPVIIVFCLVFVIDRPDDRSGAGGGDSNGDPIYEAASAIAVPTVTLDLVTGKTGSVDEDPGEPIYAEPSSGSEEIAKLQYNCCVIAADDESSNEEWISVELPNDKRTGYVRKENVTVSKLSLLDDDTPKSRVITEAVKYIGTPFIVKGQSLDEGIDCSNFVQQIYREGNVAIPDTPNEIIREGERIDKEEAEPGDVVYYDVNNGGGHVAIYLGDDFQISSMGHSGRTYPEGGVRIGKLVYRDRTEPIFYRIINW
jgi:cell wall-associated NlpC family hydrolase